MHLNVEKDVRHGLLMMKYAVNHENKFKNVHVAFLIAFLLAFVSLLIEFSVILVLTSITVTLEVIMKYVSLAAIANIPRFYYNSLVDHKLLLPSKIELFAENFRRDGIKRGCRLNLYRVIQKTLRIVYTSWSYYFMPFTALFLTYAVEEKKNNIVEKK